MCYDTDPMSLGSQVPEPFTPLSHIKYYYCIHILCHEKSWKDCITEQLASVDEKQEPEAIYLTMNSFSKNFIAIQWLPIYATAKQMSINKITQFQYVSIDQFIEKVKTTFTVLDMKQTNVFVYTHTYTEESNHKIKGLKSLANQEEVIII